MTPAVAPFAGAWVETGQIIGVCDHLTVAPFAGAWVETHPAVTHDDDLNDVAPFAGAWVETDPSSTVW